MPHNPDTERDTAATEASIPRPLAATATTAAPTVVAPSMSILPSNKARLIRGSLLVGEHLLIVTQCADKVAHDARGGSVGEGGGGAPQRGALN